MVPAARRGRAWEPRSIRVVWGWLQCPTTTLRTVLDIFGPRRDATWAEWPATSRHLDQSRTAYPGIANHRARPRSRRCSRRSWAPGRPGICYLLIYFLIVVEFFSPGSIHLSSSQRCPRSGGDRWMLSYAHYRQRTGLDRLHHVHGVARQ